MKNFLNRIRTPLPGSRSQEFLHSTFILAAGILLGIVAKFLDETPVNHLPYLLQQMDLANFFSRLGVWIFLAVLISLFSRSPFRAATGVFLFFSGMTASYYLYTIFVAGFFPRSYMMIWIVLTLLSPLAAFICWYARGRGSVSLILSSGILMVMTRQAFSLGFWYLDPVSIPEFFLWAATIGVLYQSPEQILKTATLGSGFTFLSMFFHFPGGIL